MPHKILITIIILIAVGISAVILVDGSSLQPKAETQPTKPYSCSNFGAELPTASLSYDDNDLIRYKLEKHNIEMSPSLKFSGAKAAEYCSFFADGSVPLYCTSTELVRNGEFLGNVHMVGTNDGPSAVLGVVQSDTITSGMEVVTIVTDSITESVFDCMGGISGPWIEQLSERHVVERLTTKSTINGLPMPVLLELTGSPGNYLWKILIGNAT